MLFFKAHPLAVLLIAWISLFAAPLNAQDSLDSSDLTIEEIELPIELFEVSDGLSQGYIAEVVQDQRGYLWIGSRDGLNRFDGYSFKVYRNSFLDSTSLASNYMAPIVDNFGRLFVTNLDGTLYIFDPATEQFHDFPVVATHGRGLREKWFGAQRMHDGSVVVSQGKNRWDIVLPPKSQETLEVDAFEIKPLESHYPSMQHFLRNDYETGKLFSSPDGSLWIWRTDSMFWISPQTLRLGGKPVGMANPSKDVLRRRRAGIPSSDPRFNPQGEAFLIVSDTLLKFSREAQKFVPVRLLPLPLEFPRLQLIDASGNIWIRDAQKKLLKISPVLDRIQQVSFRGNPAALNAMGDGTLYFEDNEKNLWFGTTGYGLLKIPSNSHKVKRSPALVPNYSHLHYIQRFLTPGNKALYSESLRNQWLKRTATPTFPGPGMIIPPMNVPLAVDNDNNFWFTALKPPIGNAEDTCYILRLDNSTGKIAAMQRFPKSEGRVLEFLFPDNQGHIWAYWFGGPTMQGAFYAYEITTGETRRFPIPVQGPAAKALLESDWYESPHGMIWMATNSGLFSVDRNTGETKAYFPEKGNPNSLSTHYLHCVQGDPRAPERIIWVGTQGGGLDCIDLLTGEIRHITTEDGLPNNVVYAIQFDQRNNMWLSTNNGLCLFDPTQMDFRHFNKADGFLGNEFNHFEFSKTPSGEMYFGGISGLNHFHPDDFYQTAPPSRLAINSLKLNNQPVIFGQEPPKEGYGFRLSSPMDQTRTLVFEHDHPMITLGYALFDLTAPHKNKFRYRLLGNDDNWIEAENSHEAIFTSLNPGNYTFEVMGCNSQNVWTPEPTRLNIIIRPPWWGTLWFRISVGAIIMSLLYGLYRYRLRKYLEMERLRNRIGQDLHDEIGSTLSSISLYSAVMQRTSNNLPPDTINILDKIISSTSQMMESMNDIVWTIKASNDSFEEVINRMRAFAVNMTEAQEIQMTFEVDPQVEKLSFGMEQRKNIYLIYKEAVNNAIKYAQCTELRIEIKKRQGLLELTLTDNGIGFDTEDKEGHKISLGGNGLAGMESRSAALNANLRIVSKKGQGCKVQLAVPI